MKKSLCWGVMRTAWTEKLEGGLSDVEDMINGQVRHPIQDLKVCLSTSDFCIVPPDADWPCSKILADFCLVLPSCLSAENIFMCSKIFADFLSLLGGAETLDHCLHSCVPWLCVQPILELQGCFLMSFCGNLTLALLQVRLYLVGMCPRGRMAIFGR